MPHVIVKLWPGQSEQQKTRLADKIAKDVMDVLNLRRRICVGRLRRNQIAGLERESLQAGYPGQVGHVVQQARIRDVKAYRNHKKDRKKQ